MYPLSQLNPQCVSIWPVALVAEKLERTFHSILLDSIRLYHILYRLVSQLYPQCVHLTGGTRRSQLERSVSRVGRLATRALAPRRRASLWGRGWGWGLGLGMG